MSHLVNWRLNVIPDGVLHTHAYETYGSTLCQFYANMKFFEDFRSRVLYNVFQVQ